MVLAPFILSIVRRSRTESKDAGLKDDGGTL